MKTALSNERNQGILCGFGVFRIWLKIIKTAFSNERNKGVYGDFLFLGGSRRYHPKKPHSGQMTTFERFASVFEIEVSPVLVRVHFHMLPGLRPDKGHPNSTGFRVRRFKESQTAPVEMVS